MDLIDNILNSESTIEQTDKSVNCYEYNGFDIIYNVSNLLGEKFKNKVLICRCCYFHEIIYKMYDFEEFINIDVFQEVQNIINNKEKPINGTNYCKRYNCFCGLPKKIENLRISLYTRCNAKCEFCSIKGFTTNSLEKELYFKTLYSLKGKIKKLYLTDCGEPFLPLKEMKEFLKSLKKGDFEELRFITNGTLIDDELIETIKNYHVNINISLNATNKEDYKKIVGLDCFDKVVSNIKKLNKIGVYPSVSFVYYEPLFGKLYTLKEELKRLGIENDIIVNPDGHKQKYYTKEYLWWVDNNRSNFEY